MIELVVLDMAGTTIEEHQTVYRVLAEAARAAGGEPTDAQVAQWHGAEKRDALTHLIGGPAGDVDPHRVADALVDFRARLAAAYAEQPPTPMAGVPDALAVLRGAGVQVALTTGFDREVADKVLAALGWDAGVVDAVVCGDEVRAGRPAPFMVHRAMERTGVTDVRRVLVAGDTPRDLEAGTNSGARLVVGVLSGAGSVDDLGPVAHTHLVRSVADIPFVLGLV